MDDVTPYVGLSVKIEDYDWLGNVFDKVYLAKVGVEASTPLWGEDYSRPLTRLPKFGVPARYMDKKERYADSSGKKKTVQDSMASVWDNTSLLNRVYKKLETAKEEDMIAVFLREKGGHYNEKVAKNIITSLVVQAYIDMAEEEFVTPARAKQKGFANAAIGTGQTIKAIKTIMVGGD